MDGSLDDPGISPRAIRSLFEEATKAVTDGDDNDESTLNAWTYKFKFSVLEIYNESILDLLPGHDSSSGSGTVISNAKKDSKDMKAKSKAESGLELRQVSTGSSKDAAPSMVVSGLSIVDVTSADEVDNLLVFCL